MNILFISNRSAYFKSAFGGAETSLKLIAEEMAKRGHKVKFLTKRFEPKIEFGARSVMINNVEVVSVNFLSENNLITHNYKMFMLFMRLLNECQSRIFSFQLRNLMINSKIEIAYCFYELNILNKLIDFQKKGFPLKIVMRMAGNHWYEQCKREPDLIPLYQKAFNTIDMVNFLHDKMESEMERKFDELKMNVHFKNYFTGDIGTSSNIGRSNEYVGSLRGDFKILMAARFSSYQKRQDILVRAIKYISPEIPVKVTLLGEGVRKNEIIELIHNLNLENRVSVEPFCNQKELWYRLSQTHLLCHACEYEGVSKIIIESMAMGVPVLVSDVMPINQDIVDGENGFLVENEPKAWADRIMYLYHHQELLVDVSRRSITYVDGKYNPKNNILVYEKAFSEIVQATTQTKTNA